MQWHHVLCLRAWQPGSVTKRCHKRAICGRNKCALYICRSHHFTYRDGMYAVNEHFQRVVKPKNFAEPWLLTHDKVSLHHYVLKSREVSGAVFPQQHPSACTAVETIDC